MTATFCGECGQKRGSARLSLRKMIADYLQDALSVERGLPHSLVILLTRPGVLTAEYLSGRRTRYVSPLKLYMLASVVVFATFVLTRPLDKAFYGYHGHADWEVVSNALAYGFLLSVPLFALALKILYLRGGRSLADHLVFTLYGGAAVLLCGLGFLLLDTVVKLTWGTISQAPLDPVAVFYAVPVLLVGYLFQSLRHVYPDTYRGTLARFFVLLGVLLVMSIGILAATVQATNRFGNPVDYVDPGFGETG